nr:MAG TPA: hypothetical protein [Caudoviricetes sp.]
MILFLPLLIVLLLKIIMNYVYSLIVLLNKKSFFL